MDGHPVCLASTSATKVKLRYHRKSPFQASWIKQHYVAWAMMLVTGARPGSLALPESWSDTDMYLRWKDIRFVRIPDKASGIFLEINLLWLKGQRQSHKSLKRRGVTFVIYPPRLKKNICADLTWLFLKMAIERGLFGDSEKVTMHDLERSSSFVLTQDEVICNEPVFRGGLAGRNGIADEVRPLNTSCMTGVLQATSRLAGMTVRATPYNFRREALTAFERSGGRALARALATHVPADPGSLDYYDYDVGDVNVTEVRFAEGKYSTAEARNHLRQLLSSPAIHNIATPFNEAACKKHVTTNLRLDPDRKEFDDARRYILDLFRSRFNSTASYPANLARQLREQDWQPDNMNSLGVLTLPSNRQDASSWMSAADRENRPSFAADLLDAFMKARSSQARFICAVIKREYIQDWKGTSRTPTVAEVNERISAANNPVVPRPKWDGEDVDDPDFGMLDADEDIKEEVDDDHSDLVVEDGARAKVDFPDEIEGESGISDGYEETRSAIIAAWDGLTDTWRGRHDCVLCKAHPWQPSKVPLLSGFKYDRHVCAPTGAHVPSKGNGAVIEDYSRWSRNDDGRYYCPLCLRDDEGHSYVEYKKLSQHLKKHHQDFVDSLAE